MSNKVNKSVIVPHSADQMFVLVDDVAKYPEFLPWCGGVEIETQTDEKTVATVKIDYHGVKQHFATENSKSRPTSMVMQFKSGPFKTFHGQWQFQPLTEDACKILFELEYEFSNSLFEKMIAPVFNHIANTFVDCFVTRADSIY